MDLVLREEVATTVDVATVRVDLANLRQELQATKRYLIRWMVGLGIAQSCMTAVLVRYLPY